MKIESYTFPHSSFLSVEKDMDIITNTLIKNDNLKRLLHYTTKDCLSLPKLTEDETLELFGKNIKMIPKLYVDNSVLNYISVSFDNFTPNMTNPEFRDNIIEFDIVCHFDQWQLRDFKLRPYRIAAEIDSMFNGKYLTGIGKLEFFGANQEVINNEYAGLCLMYNAIHGEEDKKNMPNPFDEASMIENFNQIFNSDEE